MQAMKKGYKLFSSLEGTEISDSKTGRVLMTCRPVGNSFVLNLKTRKDENNFALIARDASLSEWHKRLAHVNVHKIIEMSKEGLIPKIKIDCDPNKFVCDGCMKGKMCSKSFKTAVPREVKVGEAFHCDLVGPMEVSSIRGSNYALVIKDEFSSFRSIYFITHKSDTFVKIDEHIKETEKITGSKVKIMRSDNGLEFVNSKVETIVKNNVITHELSCPYTPQQNGLIERENRSIAELARSMLFGSKLPNEGLESMLLWRPNQSNQK